jgi:YidC/Oxa1 family membrane protein insertase
MNDIRRTILWVVFGFSVIMLWDQWQIHNGKKPTFFPSVNPVATNVATQTPNTPPTAVVQESMPSLPSETNNATTHDTASALEIETDVLKLRFDHLGANVTRAELIQHKDAHHQDSNVVLMDNSKERVYLAQTGLVGAPVGTAWPTHKTAMRLVSPSRFKDGEDSLVLRFESDVMGGVKLIKSYTLHKKSYVIGVQHEILNQSGQSITPQIYVQLVRDGNKPEGESSFYSTFTGPAVYTSAKKYQKVEFADIEKNKADFEKKSDIGYVAMVQHYFASAWLMDDAQSRDIYARKIDNNLYSVGMVVPLPTQANESQSIHQAKLFVGPQEEKLLENLYPGLELVKDYGWLTILAKPLYWLLDKLFGFIGNWGWSIVALVVLLKIAFYWLNSQAYKSMGKMKAINPKIMEMRERLKDNPQQMQMEMMKIYREEKVNPLGGCLPIAVQIPFFIALYWVLLSSVEMRNAPWVGWVHDLAAPDPWFILPLLMTATSLLQTWLNPTPPDPVQAKMMWIMPLAFSVMFFFFPAGLVLYWLSNNILSIAQQWMINKQLGVLK